MLLLFFGGFQGKVGPLDPELLGSNAGGIEDVSHMWIALKKLSLKKVSSRFLMMTCHFIKYQNRHVAGGEEDGVNNEDANPEDLYSTPEALIAGEKLSTAGGSSNATVFAERYSKTSRKLPDVDLFMAILECDSRNHDGRVNILARVGFPSSKAHRAEWSSPVQHWVPAHL